MSFLKFAGAAACALTAGLAPSTPAHAQILVTLHSFGNGTDGQEPSSGLILENGNLDGLTYAGGLAGQGIAYRFNIASGIETPVYNFTGGTDGSAPTNNLVYLHGLLYGISQGSTGAESGDVFEINPVTGGEKSVHVFTGGADGDVPTAGLLAYADGLYGTTLQGGASNQGVVYRIDGKTKAETIIYNFSQSAGDLSAPYGTLARVGATLYGTANTGGTAGGGGVYQLDLSTGLEKVLLNLGGSADPLAGVVFHGGYLYGVTTMGGAPMDGTVFKLNPATSGVSTLYTFQSLADGADPESPLIYIQGYLYGTTAVGGAHGQGTVFAMDAKTGAKTIFYNFAGSDGRFPYGLTYVNGFLYGTTFLGGQYDQGTLFRLQP